jgi:hypothetical protein
MIRTFVGKTHSVGMQDLRMSFLIYLYYNFRDLIHLQPKAMQGFLRIIFLPPHPKDQ